MTRVAYVCADPGVPVFGHKGCSIHVQEMIRALEREGATVELFAACRGGEAPDDLAHVPVRELAMPGALEPPVRERALLRACELAADEFEAAGRVDLLYERYSLWSCATLERARALRAPSVLEINAPLPEEQRRHRQLVDVASAERVARRALRAASVNVAVSDSVAHWARARAGGRPVVTIPNGVDVDRFDTATEQRSPDVFTIGFVGSLRPWHGVMVLVEAFRRLALDDPAYRLVIAGDGPELDKARAALDTSGLSGRATLPGAVPHADVPRIVASFDVATAPYTAEQRYFSPLKVIEYLAAARPVVASATGFDDPIVVDGVTALLVDAGDAQDLASAVARPGPRRSRCPRARPSARRARCPSCGRSSPASRRGRSRRRRARARRRGA